MLNSLKFTSFNRLLSDQLPLNKEEFCNIFFLFFEIFTSDIDLIHLFYVGGAGGMDVEENGNILFCPLLTNNKCVFVFA